MSATMSDQWSQLHIACFKNNSVEVKRILSTLKKTKSTTQNKPIFKIPNHLNHSQNKKKLFLNKVKQRLKIPFNLLQQRQNFTYKQEVKKSFQQAVHVPQTFPQRVQNPQQFQQSAQSPQKFQQAVQAPQRLQPAAPLRTQPTPQVQQTPITTHSLHGQQQTLKLSISNDDPLPLLDLISSDFL